MLFINKIEMTQKATVLINDPPSPDAAPIINTYAVKKSSLSPAECISVTKIANYTSPTGHFLQFCPKSRAGRFFALSLTDRKNTFPISIFV